MAMIRDPASNGDRRLLEHEHQNPRCLLLETSTYLRLGL